MGVYLGCVWTRDLDSEASGGDSRAVFIIYIVSASVCYCVYSLSSILVFGKGNYGTLDDGGDMSAAAYSAAYYHHNRPGLRDDPGNENNHGGEEIPTRCGLSASGDKRRMSDDLIQAMRNAAELRRELASLDSHIAGLLEARSQNGNRAGGA